MGQYLINLTMDILFLIWSINNWKTRKKKIDIYFIIAWMTLIIITLFMIALA